MTALYPPLTPYDTGFLEVDAFHTLHYEQSGNPSGAPVVFLHGGPGSGTQAKHRQFFDPAHYRIVLVDQRGTGRSTPLGEVQHNTTALLAADLETLRRHLRVERWHVFGGSWGSTLALFYAIQNPDVVLSLVLYGIFLMRRHEIDWLLHGVRHFFPDSWRHFTGFVPEAERGDILSAYYQRLIHPSPDVHLPAARAWSDYEGSLTRLIPAARDPLADPARLAAAARIEAHYFLHNRFDPDDALLRGIPRIRHIPAILVQGRYDMVCPPATADEVHRHWPEAELIVVPDAGHSASEPGMTAALITATDRFRFLP